MADYSNVPFGDEKPAQVSPDTSIPELATPTRKKSIYDDMPLPPQPEVSTVLQNAQTVKPDEAARAQQLGVPDRVYTEDKQKIEDRAFVEEKSQMLQDFPATSFWLTKNPDNAKLVSDDLNATVKFEEAVKTFVTPEELGTVANTLATMWEKSQNVDVARNITAGAYKGLGSIIQGGGEMLNVYSRSVSGAIDGVLDSLGLTAVKEAINTPVPSFLIPGEVLRQAGETINTVGKAVSDSIPADRQNFQDTVGEGVGQAAAQMTAIIMTGGGAAGPITFKTVGEMVMGARAAFMMLAQGATQAAEDTKKFGVYGTPEGDSAIMLGAGATAVAERFANNLIFSKIPQYFSGLASRVMAGATTEAVSEAYEQVLNNLAAIALYDPSRSVADQVAENAKAGGAVGAVLSGLLPGASLVTKDFKNATVAEKRAADMDAILKSLEQSKLAARSPAAFDDMLATVTSELNMGDVFIPVSALDKVTGDVADIIYPSLGLTDEQVQAARARGGDVKVSAANFVREMNLDPTRYEAIRNEMRFAEDAPSLNDVAAIQDVAAAEQADEAVRNAQAADTADPSIEAPTPESQAATEAVDIATRELGLQAMILDTSVMSASENAEYMAKVAKARRAAEVRQEAKVLRAQQKVLSAEYASEKATIRPVIEATVKLRPEYKAMDDIGQDQLDYEAVVDLWGAQAEGMATLPKQLSPTGGSRSIVSKPGTPGLAPEVVADRAGFPNVRAMMDALSTLTPFEQAVEEATDAAMKQRYPDLFDRQTAIDSARQELLSDDTAEVLAAEFDAIRAARKEGRTSAKLIRAAAKAGLADMKVGDISVNAFISTMIRKGQRAGMYLRGTARDPNTQQNLPPSRDMAAQAKFEQLMNLEYARAATGIVQKTEAAARHMAKLADPSGKFPGIVAEYMDQIRERLAGFDFSDSKTKGSSDTHYTDLSLKDFHQIHAEVVFLEKQGRLQQTLFDRKQERDLNTTVERLLETVAEPRPPEPTLGDPFGMKLLARAEANAKREAVTLNDSTWKKFKNKVLGWGAYTAKVELEMKRLDNGQLTGPWQKALFQPLAHAEALELDMDKKAMKPLLEAIEAINKDSRKTFGRAEYDPTLGISLSMADRVMIALNSGNEGNLQTMIEGSAKDDRITVPWTAEAIAVSNARLTPEMADLVQKVWNGFAKLQPEVEAIYRRHVGNNFKAVKPTKVMVGGKELTGGYYPIVYDHTRSGDLQKLSTLEKMKDPMYRAMVFSGMTEERTGYSAPIMLDLSGLPHAMRQQIHYVTHFEAVDNVNKVLSDPRITAAIKKNLGEPYYQMLDDWLSAVASNNADHSGTAEVNQTISALRSNITIATLGLSATTLAAQTFGTTSSVKVLGEQPNGKFSSREGLKWMAIGYDQYLSDPAKLVEFVREASGEMRHRIGNAERDMMQTLARIQDKAGLYTDIQRASLMAIGGMQFYTVDMPTWIAGMNKAVANGLEGQAAVDYADAVVRLSQASGKIKDLSAIQRGKGFGQAITMFATWTMLQFEQGVQSGRKLAKDPASATAETLWMFAIPAVAAAMMRQQAPEEDDEALAWWGAKIALDGARSVPVLGAGLPVIQLGSKFTRGLAGAYKDLENEELPSLKHMTDIFGPALTLGGVPGTAQALRFVSVFEAEEKGFDWNVFDAVVGFRTPEQRAKLIFK